MWQRLITGLLMALPAIQVCFRLYLVAKRNTMTSLQAQPNLTTVYAVELSERREECRSSCVS